MSLPGDHDRRSGAMIAVPSVAVAGDSLAVVAPIPRPGPYPVACSNVAQDFSRLGTLESANEYWRGLPRGDGSPRYVTDLLSEPARLAVLRLYRAQRQRVLRTLRGQGDHRSGARLLSDNRREYAARLSAAQRRVRAAHAARGGCADPAGRRAAAGHSLLARLCRQSARHRILPRATHSRIVRLRDGRPVPR